VALYCRILDSQGVSLLTRSKAIQVPFLKPLDGTKLTSRHYWGFAINANRACQAVQSAPDCG
jgi:hypothetical protein